MHSFKEFLTALIVTSVFLVLNSVVFGLEVLNLFSYLLRVSGTASKVLNVLLELLNQNHFTLHKRYILQTNLPNATVTAGCFES